MTAKKKKAKKDNRLSGIFDEIKQEVEKKLGQKEPQPAKRDASKREKIKVPTAEEIKRKFEAYNKSKNKKAKSGGKTAKEAKNFRNGLKAAVKKLKVTEETKDFIKTGIAGFDGLMEKGIPRRSSLLVAGGPGTGKTIFCLQIAANACQKGGKCIYISFEETEESLKRHMQDFGWDADKWEQDGRLIMKRISPYELSRSVEALLAKAKGELLIELEGIPAILPKDFKPDIIIVDSLTAVAAAFVERDDTYRIYIEQFFRLLEKTGATSFMITETAEAAATYSRSGVEEFMADGVIALYHIRKENVRVRGVELIKLRGAKHVEKLVPFDIVSGKGIVAYPDEEIFV